ncbi:kinase-like domain-containing protein [Dichotomocladium elegans]|nr:kinase-like domain-containing protein [Dichotomocladium elegans]
MHPSSFTDLSSMPEEPSPAYVAQRRQSIPNPMSKEKDTVMLNASHPLTPWKSADSLMYGSQSTASASAPVTAAGSTTDLKSSRLSQRTSWRSRDEYQLHSSSVDTPSSLTQRFRKFSFSRLPGTPTSPRHPPIKYTPADVVMTNTINKDYDPTTGNKLINKYMIIEEIGRGVHGKVKLAEDTETGELVAIKIVDKRTRRRQLGYSLLRGNSQNHVRVLDGLKKPTELPQYKENEQKIRREIAILKKCAHPHVVRLREVIDDPASRKIYMALEYMEGGEIEWRDENEAPVLSVDEARSVFRDVVSGLDYLHYQGIIHRDIKPANLLLTGEHVVKISDFGVSYFNELLAGDDLNISRSPEGCSRIDRELAETAGTPAFFAPELCSAGDMPLSPTSDEGAESVNSVGSSTVSHRPRITKAIDVWALGVTLYCLIFGRCPFTASTEFELFDIIPTEPLKFPDPEEIGFSISDELKHLLIRLLTKNPEERITLEEVKHHPWVIEDLDDPVPWWEEADPRRYKAVEVTDEDVTQAVTIMDRLRKSIQKLSSSLSNLTHGITRRRSKSTSSSNTPPSQQHQQKHHRQPHHISQRLPDPSPISPLIHGKPSFSTSTIPHQSSFGASHGLTRPQSEIYPDLEEEEEAAEYDESPNDPSHNRPSLHRQTSSASSSSGLAITIRRYRGGLDSKVPPPLHLTSQK